MSAVNRINSSRISLVKSMNSNRMTVEEIIAAEDQANREHAQRVAARKTARAERKKLKEEAKEEGKQYADV